MTKATSLCVTVGKGGVGESGATSLVTHAVSGPSTKVMVMRVTESSLCPNTGVIAVLAVNGAPVSSGKLAAPQDAIQADVSPGDKVAAIAHAVPLLNGIVCVRLGELSFVLQECDLERTGAGSTAGALSSSGACVPAIETRDWYAWNNLMPPKPDVFHLQGEVQVGNPGVDVFLSPRTPQGINPRILLIDLVLVQRPGIWPQVLVWKAARYEKANVTYDQVQIFSDGQPLLTLPVDNVQ